MGGEHAFGASLQEVYLAACETVWWELWSLELLSGVGGAAGRWGGQGRVRGERVTEEKRGKAGGPWGRMAVLQGLGAGRKLRASWRKDPARKDEGGWSKVGWWWGGEGWSRPGALDIRGPHGREQERQESKEPEVAGRWRRWGNGGVYAAEKPTGGDL